jgi:hypothetical protein
MPHLQNLHLMLEVWGFLELLGHFLVQSLVDHQTTVLEYL